ncbi:MAG: hypothetical protein ACHQ0J_01780 [Candidatus Dormibacterales bacterium]
MTVAIAIAYTPSELVAVITYNLDAIPPGFTASADTSVAWPIPA